MATGRRSLEQHLRWRAGPRQKSPRQDSLGQRSPRQDSLGQFARLRPSRQAVAPQMTSTARDIQAIMAKLDLDAVARHFDVDEEEVAPMVVCENVSVDAFNDYVGDGEGLRIALRFLQLSGDGRLAIIDVPTAVHESPKTKFGITFLLASGNPLAIGDRASVTARRPGNPNKEADATYGPLRSTPNRAVPPANYDIGDWVTLAVEVGRSQSWASLEEAARWWCGYDGIQYILLLKVSPTAIQMRYALYDITALGTLPVPTASGTFRHNRTRQPAATITFDMHRILSVPAGQALPVGVNPIAVVDLRTVMDLIIDNF